MSQLFLLPRAVRRDPSIDRWMRGQGRELGEIAKHWFEMIRQCGEDVREVLHDGHPTACVGEAAFAYVNAFKAHVNVGFFRGAELADPAGLLEGSGKLMRHVKIGPGRSVDATALLKLIRAAYADMKDRVQAEPPHATMTKAKFKVGDKIRVIGYRPGEYAPGFVDDMGTEDLFKSLVGRRYTIRGFDDYGHIELRPKPLHSVWIEPDLVQLVKRRNAAR